MVRLLNPMLRCILMINPNFNCILIIYPNLTHCDAELHAEPNPICILIFQILVFILSLLFIQSVRIETPR